MPERTVDVERAALLEVDMVTVDAAVKHADLDLRPPRLLRVSLLGPDHLHVPLQGLERVGSPRPGLSPWTARSRAYVGMP